jgi:predicted metal-dependent hydrolase
MEHATDRLERTAEALERGRELYAAGRFFEAHAAWDVAWREESGTMRRLLQGLIQAAGAYHKMAVQRQPRGMTRLLAMALDRLQPIPDGFAGLRLDRFRAALVQSREEAFAWYSGGPAPSGPAPLGTYLTEPWRPAAPG